MALAELNFYSESLGTQQTVNVIIPQRNASGEIGIENGGAAEKYKCLYLLHGLSDNQTIWLRRTSIERYAQEYGICVVMPFGDRSFYTDMKFGGKYYTYIAKELPRVIREFFNVSKKREDNYIAGLSMGGYGALKIGMRECETFCAAAGLSSVADIEREKEMWKQDAVNIFGLDMKVPDEDDLFKIAEKCSENPLKPRIYMGCGTEDFLYGDNIRLKEKFESLNFDYKYRESPGAHSWDFWDEYIQYVLKWMLEKQ